MTRSRHSVSRKFNRQRWNAGQRDIPFLLTLAEWWDIWQQSGHWRERGVGRSKYVMARYGDRGAYEVGNVRICKFEENCIEYNASPKAQAVHAARLGYRHMPATRAKLSASQMGNKYSLGHRHTAETRALMSAARTLWHKQRCDEVEGRGTL